jgi:hypothetical protein
MAELTNEEIASLVQTTAAEYRIDHMDLPELRVPPESVRRDGEWYYVAVVAAQRPARAYPYYDHLRALESRMQDEHDLDVVLVPARAA